MGLDISLDSELELFRKVYNSWYGLCEQYKRSDLTFTRDKLIALSAVAKEMETAVGDQYIAGIWESQVHDNLQWETTKPSARRSRSLRAPSWSWACVDGEVSIPQCQPPNQRTGFVGHLLEACINLVPESHSNVICTGTLRLSCRLYPMTVTAASLPANREGLKIKSERWGRTSWIIPDDLTEVIESTFRVFFLLLQISIDDENDEYIVYGLLLKPTGQRKGQLERFGTLQSNISKDDMELFKKPWPDLGKLEFEEELDDCLIAISVI